MINQNELRIMADLLDEAARNLRGVMEEPIAETLQIRHFLPDELEGSAIMLRDAVLDDLGFKRRNAATTLGLWLHQVQCKNPEDTEALKTILRDIQALLVARGVKTVDAPKMPRMPAYVCREDCQEAKSGREHCAGLCRVAHGVTAPSTTST